MSKIERIGKETLQRIHIHNPDQGGVLTETTGAMGSAKTAVNLAFTDYTINHYPKEKIFWSECYDSPLQIFKLKNKDKIRFFIKKDDNMDIVFRDRDKKLKIIDLNPTFFSNFDDLYRKAVSGHVNVVFFGDRKRWMEFVKYLRSVGEWVHVFIEEFSEIAPMFPSRKEWYHVRNFAKCLKDVRKCMINLHYNTQQKSDVHYECRNKVMIKIYLPGATRDRNCRVTQIAIDNLERDIKRGNQAYLVEAGIFGRVRFGDIYKPQPGFHIEAHVIKKEKPKEIKKPNV